MKERLENLIREAREREKRMQTTSITYKKILARVTRSKKMKERNLGFQIHLNLQFMKNS